MLDSFDKGWFVLQTYSGYENKVKENIKNNLKDTTLIVISQKIC